MITENSTVKQAKQFLRDNYIKGTKCPCCDQNVKLHPFKLTSGVAAVLIKFYKERDKGWINPIKEFKTNNGNYAKLRHWGFLEKKSENDNPKIKSSGLWRITPTGILFATNKIDVQEKVKLYNNQYFGREGDWITIKDALGTKFDFEELMNS